MWGLRSLPFILPCQWPSEPQTASCPITRSIHIQRGVLKQGCTGLGFREVVRLLFVLLLLLPGTDPSTYRFWILTLTGKHTGFQYPASASPFVCVCFHIMPCVNCFGRTVLYVRIEYCILVNMYYVSAQGVDERMINVHYYYYYCGVHMICKYFHINLPGRLLYCT